jgi:hypothetical protein
MRTAPAQRQAAEIILSKEGWTVVKISKDLMVVAQPNKMANLTKWCEDHLGPGRIEPGHQWLDGHDVWYAFSWFGYWSFHFKNNRDATAFAMRWV